MAAAKLTQSSNSGRSHNKRVGGWVVPLLLIVALFQNYYDIVSVMNGGVLKLYKIEGPVWIRFTKDVTYIFIIVSILYYAFRTRTKAFGFVFCSVFLICVMLALISSQMDDPLTAVIGLRWATPLLIFLIAVCWSQDFDGAKAIPWAYTGMLICLGLQFYQLFYMPPVYGTIFGLSARTPGIFLAPNSASFFGCALAAFIHVYSRTAFKHLLISSIIAFAISALAQSGTGIVVCFALLMQTFFSRLQLVLFVAVGISIPMIFSNLDRVLNRDDFVEISGGGRIDRLNDIIQESAFSFDNFGFYTNAANLADENSEYRVAVDSLVASMIGNFGITFLAIIVLLGLFIFKNFRDVNLKIVFSPLIVFTMFSFTTIIFEAYPMNIVLVLALWGAVKMSQPRNRIN
jgi:hypothetical protein